MSAKKCPEIVLKFDKNLVLKFHFVDWDPWWFTCWSKRFILFKYGNEPCQIEVYRITGLDQSPDQLHKELMNKWVSSDHKKRVTKGSGSVIADWRLLQAGRTAKLKAWLPKTVLGTSLCGNQWSDLPSCLIMFDQWWHVCCQVVWWCQISKDMFTAMLFDNVSSVKTCSLPCCLMMSDQQRHFVWWCQFSENMFAAKLCNDISSAK